MSGKNNIVLFDWDDTLLPSSHLIKLGYISKNGEINENNPIDTETLKLLADLQDLISGLIQLVSSASSFYIVTNAQQGWVQSSMKTFLPKLTTLIQDSIIISARSTYKDINDPTYDQLNPFLRYKVLAFKDILKSVKDITKVQIISFGDNQIDSLAAHLCSDNINRLVVKSIQLSPLPNIRQLIQQISLIKETLDYIYSSQSSICLKFDIHQENGKITISR